MLKSIHFCTCFTIQSPKVTVSRFLCSRHRCGWFFLVLLLHFFSFHTYTHPYIFYILFWRTERVEFFCGVRRCRRYIKNCTRGCFVRIAVCVCISGNLQKSVATRILYENKKRKTNTRSMPDKFTSDGECQRHPNQSQPDCTVL